MTQHGNGAALWLVAAAGMVGIAACVEGTPETEMGGATFFQGAPMAPGATSDYTPATAQPAAAGSSGTTSTPVTPTAPPNMPVTPSMSAGSGAPVPPISTAGTGAIAQMGGAGGAGGATPAVGGSGGAGTAGSGAPPMMASTPGTLTVSVTSAAVGGRYAPRNVGAIWIETGSGQFVKTIERWAAIRAGDLRGWSQRSGGWGFEFFGASSSPDAVDCVTAATLTSHRAHNPTWAMKDANGMVVPDGAYKVVLEVGDGSNAVSEVMFTKGPMAQTVMAPAGGRGYSSFSVTYTP